MDSFPNEIISEIVKNVNHSSWGKLMSTCSFLLQWGRDTKEWCERKFSVKNITGWSFRNGYRIDWFIEGKVKSRQGFFLNGCQEGIWIYWDKDGVESHKVHFTRGIKNGQCP